MGHPHFLGRDARIFAAEVYGFFTKWPVYGVDAAQSVVKMPQPKFRGCV